MTTRLRTLKNLDFSYPEVSEDEYQKIFDKEKKEELRLEAIKWYKKLNLCCSSEGFAAEEEIQKWIVHFFNLKEKDLK